MQFSQLRSGEGDTEATQKTNRTRLDATKKGSKTTRRQTRKKDRTKIQGRREVKKDIVDRDRDIHIGRQSEEETERRKRGRKTEIKKRRNKGRKEENIERRNIRGTGRKDRMMSSGLDSWKRHDSGVKSSDDDLENTLTVGEFDGALTGLDLADNEINNNSISHWIRSVKLLAL